MNEWIRLLFERSLIDMPRLGEVNFCSQARSNHCRVGTLVGFFTSTVKLYTYYKNHNVFKEKSKKSAIPNFPKWVPGFPNVVPGFPKWKDLIPFHDLEDYWLCRMQTEASQSFKHLLHKTSFAMRLAPMANPSFRSYLKRSRSIPRLFFSSVRASDTF